LLQACSIPGLGNLAGTGAKWIEDFRKTINLLDGKDWDNASVKRKQQGK
jgi:hypothetical protein